MSCVLIYYDVFLSIVHYPSFYMPLGVGLQGKSKLVIIKSQPRLYLHLSILKDLSTIFLGQAL
jgi:hypothetical protein